MTRPFSLRVHGEDHHHDRARDAQGRMPSDVAAEQEFLHRTSTVIHALRDGGYRLVAGGGKAGWHDLKSRRQGRPDIQFDMPSARFDGPDDVANADLIVDALATALGSGSSAIHHPPHPSTSERLAQERHDAAFSLIVRRIADGSIPMHDPELDSVWVHAGTPWSRAVIHCRRRTGIIRSIPIDDGILDPSATAIVQSHGWIDDETQRPQWKLICWATSFGRDELPDAMQTLRSLAAAG